MAPRQRCRHLLDVAHHELSLFQSRFAGLRRASHLPASTPAPCEMCGDARLRRGDDTLVCLHCGYVGCWSPFPANEPSSGKHGQLHLTAVGTHWLGVHVVRFELYCGHCGDFVRDDRFLKFCESASKLSPGFRV